MIIIYIIKLASGKAKGVIFSVKILCKLGMNIYKTKYNIPVKITKNPKIPLYSLFGVSILWFIRIYVIAINMKELIMVITPNSNIDVHVIGAT